MGFVQIIDYVTDQPEEIEKAAEAYREERGPGAVTRSIVTKDRDRDRHYLVIVEFPSYEDAMANSEHPATQQFAKTMMTLCEGPPTFYNLDLIRTETAAT